MWVRSHRVTRSQDQILRAAANNRVCGHASGCGVAGHFDQDPIRPEKAWTFRPKAWTFLPKAWMFLPMNIDVSAKKIDVSARKGGRNVHFLWPKWP